MEIDQLTATSITLTLWAKTFLRESDDLVPLGTPIIVFLRQRHRDGESLSSAISSVIDLSFVYEIIAPVL